MKMRRIAILLLVVLVFFGCKNSSGEEGSYSGGGGSNKDHISTLPPMKDDFAGKFNMVGDIFDPVDVSSTAVTNTALTRHFNVLTAQNNMKPDQLSSGKGTYNFTTADRMVNAAIASGFKVVGHTLLWHSQIPKWQENVSSSTALTDMKNYITDVVGHFKGRIYSWDVLNEVFPDSGYTSDWKTSMRQENPWNKSIGSDFVYEGFLAARKADPNAILYYNDYNTDMASKANMIRDMVLAVNNKYLTGTDKPTGEDSNRLLIEGIGMQEHHNTNVSPGAIRTTLNLFKPLGVKISVSELDVISQSWQDFDGKKAVTDAGRKKQAELYGEYIKVYLEFNDIIERVSFWGVYDNKSWRAKGEPLLFDSDGNAKAAYNSVINALK